MSKRKKTKKKHGAHRGLLKEEILNVFTKHPNAVYNYTQIAAVIGVRDTSGRKLIIDILNRMTDQKLLLEKEVGKYKLVSSHFYLIGKLELTSTGNGYAVCEGQEKDIFISKGKHKNALNGDTVKVKLNPKSRKKKPEGMVVEVVSRSKTEFVGVLQASAKFAFVVLDDFKMNVDFYVPLSKLNGAKNGQKVIVKLTDWPSHASSPFGEITEIIGFPGDNNVEMLSILAEKGFAISFPDEVIKAAEAIDPKILEKEIAKRRDFRKILTFTIDPYDAKDFDDALSYQKLKNGNIEVGVHIADVTHYVTLGSIIDEEALERATSVYLVDRVAPMLPEVLSNQLCSLRPHEEKLCFSAVFEINNKSQIVNKWFGKTVIYSDRRFAYEEVQEIIENNKGEYLEEITMLNNHAKTMRSKRMKSGSISFERSEVRFKVNENGEPTGVYIKESKDAHKLIEEYMLLANKSVSEFVTNDMKEKHPFIYRVHDNPDPMKLENFGKFISKFGYKFDYNNKNTSQSINQILEEVKGHQEENVFSTIAIRSMAKAVYTTNNIGHYGLGFAHYSHFTSPIRRYPDMIAHRLLFAYLEERSGPSKNQIEEWCKHASAMERNAVEAERESTKFFQVLLLDGRDGEIFEGVISGVSEWGIFVELVENKCEGMIRIKDIDDDYYSFDAENFEIIGNNRSKTFRLGDPITVKLRKTNLARKQIDFQYIG